MSATSAAPIVERPRRRKLAMSLRLLMVAILAAAFWMAWLANRARDQRRAVAAVMARAGSDVMYDWQEPLVNNQPAPGARLRVPAFLRRLLGDEYFQEVVSIGVGGRGEVPIATLEAIGRLPRVRYLNLAMTRVGPEGMGRLSGMTSLRSLVLGNMRVTDEALAKLSGLTDLEELYLHWSLVSDGTKYLVGMKRLRVLTLSHSKLTDEGLEHLKALPSLRQLTIHDNPLSDDAVRRFMAERPNVTVEYAFPNPPRVAASETRPR